MFENASVNIDLLKKRAYNLRWATVPDGVIPLTAADPDFPCAPEIAESICKFTTDRYFCYGPNEGLPAFKEAMASYFNDKRFVKVSPELLFPVDSAASGIYITCKALLTKNDEAIIFDPVDFLFRYSIESVGGVAITFSIPPGEKNVDFALLEHLITPKTKMICLCNPLNPTGKVFTKDELLQFGIIACKYNLMILSDEIWSDIVYDPFKYTSIASLNDDIRNRTITITGFSKSYGLAGLRIGVVVTHTPEIFTLLFTASLHQSTIHGSNIIGQIAATTALSKCDYWLKDFVAHLQLIREKCVMKLNAIEGLSCIAPQGTYVAFVNIKGTNKGSGEICDLLLEKAKVSVVPGLKQWFGEGAEGYIRISFATSHNIINESLARIENIFKTL